MFVCLTRKGFKQISSGKHCPQGAPAHPIMGSIGPDGGAVDPTPLFSKRVQQWEPGASQSKPLSPT
jgi:hypothetical protein